MKNPVGPVLRMGDEVEQVIAAIEDDNPDTEIEVIDRGAYVRVQGEDEITVTQQTLRRITWQSVALHKAQVGAQTQDGAQDKAVTA